MNIDTVTQWNYCEGIDEGLDKPNKNYSDVNSLNLISINEQETLENLNKNKAFLLLQLLYTYLCHLFHSRTSASWIHPCCQEDYHRTGSLRCRSLVHKYMRWRLAPSPRGKSIVGLPMKSLDEKNAISFVTSSVKLFNVTDATTLLYSLLSFHPQHRLHLAAHCLQQLTFPHPLAQRKWRKHLAMHHSSFAEKKERNSDRWHGLGNSITQLYYFHNEIDN